MHDTHGAWRTIKLRKINILFVEKKSRDLWKPSAILLIHSETKNVRVTEFVPESSWHVPASAEVQSFRAASRLLDTENDGCAPKRTQQASLCTELSERTSKVTTGQIYPTSLLNLNKFSTIGWTFSRAFLRIKLSATRIFKARPAARECTRHPPPKKNGHYATYMGPKH